MLDTLCPASWSKSTHRRGRKQSPCMVCPQAYTKSHACGRGSEGAHRAAVLGQAGDLAGGRRIARLRVDDLGRVPEHHCAGLQAAGEHTVLPHAAYTFVKPDTSGKYCEGYMRTTRKDGVRSVTRTEHTVQGQRGRVGSK